MSWIQLEELSAGDLTDVNDKLVVMERMRCPRESDGGKKLHRKKLTLRNTAFPCYLKVRVFLSEVEMM